MYMGRAAAAAAMKRKGSERMTEENATAVKEEKREGKEVISVQNLHFTYADGDTEVLEGVSFSVQPGEFAVLLGQNGAGKSTLLKLLLGELQPQHGGEIRLFGEDVRRFRGWQRMSFVRQNGMQSCQNFPATVLELVTANLYRSIGLFRFAGKKEKARALQALSEVGMAEYSGRLISQLSGGQQQRVLLARALVNAPELMILDEPTAGMDEKSIAEFYQLLVSVQKQHGVSILMVTHDPEKVRGLADHIFRLEDGRMRQEPLERDQMKEAPAEPALG